MAESLTSTKFPYLPVQVIIRGQERTGMVLVDTGFDGGLIIPDEWRRIVEGLPDGSMKGRVADQRVTRAPFYLGHLGIPNFVQVPNIECTVLGKQYILGRDFIRLFKITLDHGERLILEH